MRRIIPLSVPNLQGQELEYVTECINTNWVSSAGSFVNKFEGAVRDYVKAQYAVACINGTSGLQVALKLCGVTDGDEVIVPTLTFIAPVNAIKYLGAEPVFMDCDDHLNIDCDKLREFCEKECLMTKSGLKNRKTRKIIKALIPVHVFGNPCDMEALMEIARKYRLKVVEDATESLGSYYTSGIYSGRFSGTVGDIGVYSFNGNKIITTGGGGMLVTGSSRLAEKAEYLTNQAKDDPVRYVHHEIGYNFRLTNLQAALGLAQLEQLTKFIAIKKENYYLYKSSLNGIPGVELLGIPPGTAPNYWFYSLIIDKKRFGAEKEELMTFLSDRGIQARPLWYLNHLQRPYRKNQSYKIEKAVWFLKRVLNVPCSTNLGVKQVKYVVSVIRNLRKNN